MKLLIWQWGRRGAGPRYAAWLANALREAAPGTVALSLSAQAEILRAPIGPVCELPVGTYDDFVGFMLQWPLAPFRIRRIARLVQALRPDAALCAMPAPLDLIMASALKRIGVPFGVVVHDADSHPGDGFPMQMALQRALVRRADAVVALSGHVESRLHEQGALAGKRLIRSHLPPFAYGGAAAPPPLAHGGKLRLLSFGRLRPYKGLDLLATALAGLTERQDFEVRVVGSGPESETLAALRALPMVTVENRWVPEAELPALIAWADALVLSHKEASQSGGAAAAIAAGRFVVATNVGGMAEQLGGHPLARMCRADAASLRAAIMSLVDDPPAVTAPPVDVAAEWRTVALDLAREMQAVARPQDQYVSA